VSGSGSATLVPDSSTISRSSSIPAPSSASSASTSTSNPGSTDTSSSTPVPVPGSDVDLAGVNEPGCVSTEPPVVLLHGTFSTIAVDFPVLVAALTAAGRCVYGQNYGFYGSGPVRDSAEATAAEIRSVLADTGATQVDVVGFSQGGLVLRTALRFDGVSGLVRTAALISPSFHGTTSPLIDSLPGNVCGACADQKAGSALLTELAAGGDLDGAVRYATAVVSTDVIVTPWQSQLADGPAERVRSVVLDRRCPGISVRHQDMALVPAVAVWVTLALARGGDVVGDDLVCP
jgi:triacylglycerol lipase